MSASAIREQLEDFVSRERESGVYLSILGFGGGNYNDLLMQKLAQSGNGMAAYIDTLNEGRKVLNDDLSGSMFSIANDVKIQVEFNPAKVAEYRLIGYETRILNKEDFNNDKVDAGEIGAGASVTAIYEITPVGSKATLVDPSRYQTPAPAPQGATNEFAFLKMRYKLPGQDTSKLITRPVTRPIRSATSPSAPESTRFATAVAGYGSLMRGDPYHRQGVQLGQVIELAQRREGRGRVRVSGRVRAAGAAGQDGGEPEGAEAAGWRRRAVTCPARLQTLAAEMDRARGMIRGPASRLCSGAGCAETRTQRAPDDEVLLRREQFRLLRRIHCRPRRPDRCRGRDRLLQRGGISRRDCGG